MGEVKCHSESNWSSLAPCRKMNSVDGTEDCRGGGGGVDEDVHIISYSEAIDGPLSEDSDKGREAPGTEVVERQKVVLKWK